MDQINDYYLSAVTDIRDGVMDLTAITTNIVSYGGGILLSGITVEGKYNITFIVSDRAKNVTSNTITISVDSTPPVITYFSTTSGDTYTMSLSANTSTPGTISSNDIIVYSVYGVEDNVDGLMALSSITITIYRGTTIISDIETTGTFHVHYDVSDITGNNRTDIKDVTVTS